MAAVVRFRIAEKRLNCAMEVREMVTQFPFGSDFVLLRDAMNQLLQDSFIPSGGSRFPWGTSPSSSTMTRPMPLDVYATPEEAVIIAAVPGLNPQDLEITYTENTLTLSGVVPNAVDSEQDKNAMWYAHELWSGQFRRTVTLPFEVDADKAEATFEHGIVRITLPKAEWAKPQKIAIKAGTGQQAIRTGSRS
jgi:HSP20 family protein